MNKERCRSEKSGYERLRYNHLRSANVVIPVVRGIVRRTLNGDEYILVQTRYQPKVDTKYTGKLELPGGWTEWSDPSVFEALEREVREETGLTVRIDERHKPKKFHRPHQDQAFGFNPLCCIEQNISGERWLGLGLICDYVRGRIKKYTDESKNVRWMKAKELERMYITKPEEIFTLDLPILEYYFKDKKIHR